MERLFHWIDGAKLARALETGSLKPYWRHFVADRRRILTGLSMCDHPTEWRADPETDDVTPEVCLVFDAAAFPAERITLRSCETYHLTRRIKAIRRRLKGDDREHAIDKEIESTLSRREFSHGGWDEVFVLDAVPLTALCAVGIDEGVPVATEALALEVARRYAVPAIDMGWWQRNGDSPDEDWREEIFSGKDKDSWRWDPAEGPALAA